MIYILSGPIRSGKTTALSRWVNEKKDIDGILSPDNDFGQRYFLEIKSLQRFDFEAKFHSDEETICIGRFHFLKSAFNRANTYLINALNFKNTKFIVVDEVGKLELKGEGLHDSVCQLISHHQFIRDSHLLLVIRDSLLDSVIHYYNITQYNLITKESLSESLF
jgi:nucleoside-triphosphatase THEP1